MHHPLKSGHTLIGLGFQQWTVVGIGSREMGSKTEQGFEVLHNGERHNQSYQEVGTWTSLVDSTLATVVLQRRRVKLYVLKAKRKTGALLSPWFTFAGASVNGFLDLSLNFEDVYKGPTGAHLSPFMNKWLQMSLLCAVLCYWPELFKFKRSILMGLNYFGS
jgi:hypothetical protein